MHKSCSSCGHQTNEELFNALMWPIKLDESRSKQSTKSDPIPKKHDRGYDDHDEDPSIGSNQGKETKERRTGKETESSKKSSTPKESTKGKPPLKPSKSRKSRSANDDVEETFFEIGSDDVEQTFDKKADDSAQPSPDANTEQPSPDANANQPSPVKAVNPKRQKNDWYKKSPSPAPQDPDYNTVKTINDAQEQPWFKEKVNATVPPLRFDELMSTPIDFLAFTMNRLRLTTLTREVLVGPVFNLLKCTCKIYGELEYNFEKCFRALTDTLNWANPEAYDRPDMSKPLPLIENDRRLTIPIEVFFNNDLEYLKGDKAERTYCSSITKMIVARYTREGIEDLIPNLWCSSLTAYDKDALLGIKH
ncbi:hypothetical protein Tco_0965331 [Tanacetum coccineum]